jgi:hypothetical protein
MKKILRLTLTFALALLLSSLVYHAPVAWAAETQKLPEAEDAVTRKAAFESRNTPANLDNLGRDFLSRTYVGSWHPHEFNRPGGWEALKEVRARMDRKEFASALQGFKNYTLEKIRNIDGSGLPRGRFDPFSSGINGVQWIRPLLNANQKDDIIKQAQEMMTGIITVNGKRLDIGPPGTVNWRVATAGANRGSSGWPWDFEAFYPLLGAYIFTGEQRYMDSWAAYVDDWAMNQREGIGATNIADVPDQWANGVETMLTLLRYFGGVVGVPGGTSSVPEGTFARVFSRLIDDFIPISILYHRSNPQNWNDASLTALPDIGYFLDDYPIGRQLLQESRRRLDLLISTHHLPDGTEMDTTVGYSNLFIIGPATFLERINTRQLRVPDWMLTKWEKEEWRNDPNLGHWEQTIHAEMLKRARSLTGHTLASGEWPIGGTRNARRNDSQNLYNTLRYFLPDAFQNPDIANIMAISTGRRPDGVPSFTSERFPYGGHAYIRAGWDAKDAYLYMYAAPYPLSGSLSVRNNNAIGLSAYGYDLLETGENGVYDQPHSPVKVDGQEQYFQFGIPTWGHRGPMLTTSGYTSPPDWRWHDSKHFDLVEGIYAGNFGKQKKLDDVRHQRMVQYVRGAGLWIVTDRLSSPQTHNYTLDWRFGIKPGHETDFTAEQIKVDKDTIKTARPGGANVSLYHFPSTPIAFTTGEERTPPQGYRLHDFLRVSGDWKTQGESVVVTAIYPRQNQEEELTSIKPLMTKGAEGFEAVTAKGTQILYQAATSAPGSLKTAGLSAVGESLLLAIGPDGSRRGVALGCQSLLIAGKATAIPSADFEFEIVGAQLKTTPIYTPLQPVKIAPSDTTAFVGQQVVTLSCATPKAEIRYTLDGSDPTLASPLYRGPLTLTSSTVVKARSFRPGITIMPTTMSGTTASVVSEASFAAIAPAKALTPPNTIPGLRYEYYEGRWQDLLSGIDRLTPVKSGVVDKMFDISPKGTAPTYAFKYSGYFEAPVDGVYNFIAPPEFYEPNIMAAYELRLILDGKEWYPATSRHALGTWSVALQKGKHDFQAYYADLRADGVAKMNKPGEKPMVWDGTVPNIQLSGPGLNKGALAAQAFSYLK